MNWRGMSYKILEREKVELAICGIENQSNVKKIYAVPYYRI